MTGTGLGRRGLLGGFAALLASPAIIRPGLLMPVSTAALLPPALFRPITNQEILAEASRLLLEKTENADLTPWTFTRADQQLEPTPAGNIKQSWSALTIGNQARLLPMEEFSRRILAPNIDLLAKQVNGRTLLLPPSVPEAAPSPGEFWGTADSIRMVQAYDLATDEIQTRFDVLTWGS